MIRVLSLAAALAVLPLNAALAGAPRTEGQTEVQTPSEAAIEAASSAFEARMETFGTRAEAIQADKTLTDAERGTRVAALWSEYQPEVAVFTAAISQHAGEIASEALANIDIDALVSESLNSPEVQQAMASAAAVGGGMATNGAWAQNDPEQMVTYGLMAQYGVDQAMDAVDAVGDAAEAERDARDNASEAGRDAEAARGTTPSHD